MKIEWTENDAIEHNSLSKKAYYIEGRMDGLTEEEFNRFCKLNAKLAKVCANIKTETADKKSGRADKKTGYYDKWYRYNRMDEGKAYDEGFNSTTCEKEEGVTIIECMHV